jgi:hypothetical protein
MENYEDTPTLVTTVRVVEAYTKDFIEWKTQLNVCITSFPGFISLEVLSSTNEAFALWTIIQRFADQTSLAGWVHSKEHADLLEKLKKSLPASVENAVQEIELEGSNSPGAGGITEVFVTEIHPEKENAYREWIAKMHQVEAKFPGFRGMYIQSPSQSRTRSWVTLLQFDTPEHLDHWLSSPERKVLLEESKTLIAAIECHRVYSPYASWFAPTGSNGIPPVWKQTMLILLVLFPIVMLETQFLSIYTQGLNPSLATFISNAISVALISWPCLPLAIFCLNWWLSDKDQANRQKNILGILLLIGLYLLEIFIFWKR